MCPHAPVPQKESFLTQPSLLPTVITTQATVHPPAHLHVGRMLENHSDHAQSQPSSSYTRLPWQRHRHDNSLHAHKRRGIKRQRHMIAWSLHDQTSAAGRLQLVLCPSRTSAAHCSASLCMTICAPALHLRSPCTKKLQVPWIVKRA